MSASAGCFWGHPSYDHGPQGVGSPAIWHWGTVTALSWATYSKKLPRDLTEAFSYQQNASQLRQYFHAQCLPAEKYLSDLWSVLNLFIFRHSVYSRS